MHIQTLQNIPIVELTACYNRSFSDYVVPHQATVRQLENSMHANSVRTEISPIAFDGDKLVGFMLIGLNELNGRRTFYNAGTGVIPEYRGQRIVQRLYDFLLPILQEAQVEQGLLEVITSNLRAYRIYEAIGYKSSRKLLCFKGAISTKDRSPAISTRPLQAPDFDQLKSFWDWQPFWQNHIPAMKLILPDLLVYGAFDNEALAGYIIFNPIQKRVHQFAVAGAHRRKGIASALFECVRQQTNEPVGVINVDENAAPSIEFLKSMGLELFAEQYEMQLTLNP